MDKSSTRNALSLPKRMPKNRIYGLTSIYDVQLSLGQLQYLLDDFHDFIDIAKIGVGTAYVMPRLREKIALYHSYNIKVHFGGTLFEKFYHQNKLKAYKELMNEYNVNLVEISAGTIDIPLKERLDIINDFKQDFEVITEVGYKEADKTMSPSIWLREIKELLNTGCSYVITEGRASGKAGIYKPSGTLKMGLIDDISREIDVKNIIFEAPTPTAQATFIKKFGTNVNLGNVKPNDVLLLETQRQGLRSETFFINE